MQEEGENGVTAALRVFRQAMERRQQQAKAQEATAAQLQGVKAAQEDIVKKTAPFVKEEFLEDNLNKNYRFMNDESMVGKEPTNRRYAEIQDNKGNLYAAWLIYGNDGVREDKMSGNIMGIEFINDTINEGKPKLRLSSNTPEDTYSIGMPVELLKMSDDGKSAAKYLNDVRKSGGRIHIYPIVRDYKDGTSAPDYTHFDRQAYQFAGRYYDNINSPKTPKPLNNPYLRDWMQMYNR